MRDIEACPESGLAARHHPTSIEAFQVMHMNRNRSSFRPQRSHVLSRGFTLIEVMVTVAIIGILAGIALPSYTDYVTRSKIPPALDGLSAYATRMEQRFQDVGNYDGGSGACTVPIPTIKNFTLTCAINGAGFVATATGTGQLAGYTYTIDDRGARTTTAHPKGTPASACWSMKGKICDN